MILGVDARPHHLAQLERFLAKRMNAATIELESSHVAMLSHPKEIAALIQAAATHAGA